MKIATPINTFPNNTLNGFMHNEFIIEYNYLISNNFSYPYPEDLEKLSNILQQDYNDDNYIVIINLLRKVQAFHNNPNILDEDTYCIRLYNRCCLSLKELNDNNFKLWGKAKEQVDEIIQIMPLYPNRFNKDRKKVYAEMWDIAYFLEFINDNYEDYVSVQNLDYLMNLNCNFFS